MGNKFEIEINESEEELKHRLHHSVSASSREKLQMLYWLERFGDRALEKNYLKNWAEMNPHYS